MASASVNTMMEVTPGFLPRTRPAYRKSRQNSVILRLHFRSMPGGALDTAKPGRVHLNDSLTGSDEYTRPRKASSVFFCRNRRRRVIDHCRTVLPLRLRPNLDQPLGHQDEAENLRPLGDDVADDLTPAAGWIHGFEGQHPACSRNQKNERERMLAQEFDSLRGKYAFGFLALG